MIHSKKRIARVLCTTSLACVATPVAVAQETVESKTVPVGDAKFTKVRTLEAGAKALQSNTPMKGFDIHLVGFHPIKDHPEMQMKAHHRTR